MTGDVAGATAAAIALVGLGLLVTVERLAR